MSNAEDGFYYEKKNALKSSIISIILYVGFLVIMFNWSPIISFFKEFGL